MLESSATAFESNEFESSTSDFKVECECVRAECE